MLCALSGILKNVATSAAYAMWMQGGLAAYNTSYKQLPPVTQLYAMNMQYNGSMVSAPRYPLLATSISQHKHNAAMCVLGMQHVNLQDAYTCVGRRGATRSTTSCCWQWGQQMQRRRLTCLHSTSLWIVHTKGQSRQLCHMPPSQHCTLFRCAVSLMDWSTFVYAGLNFCTKYLL